jgi:hypothetical protein
MGMTGNLPTYSVTNYILANMSIEVMVIAN